MDKIANRFTLTLCSNSSIATTSCLLKGNSTGTVLCMRQGKAHFYIHRIIYIGERNSGGLSATSNAGHTSHSTRASTKQIGVRNGRTYFCHNLHHPHALLWILVEPSLHGNWNHHGNHCECDDMNDSQSLSMAALVCHFCSQVIREKLVTSEQPRRIWPFQSAARLVDGLQCL